MRKNKISLILILGLVLNTLFFGNDFGVQASGDEASLREVAHLTNVVREEVGQEPLSLLSSLNVPAQVRAVETMTLFAHQRPDGSNWYTVLDEAGLTYRRAGENIAAGYASPQAVVTAWKESAGHYGNMIDSSFSHIGVGYLYDASADYRYYWVQLFLGGCDVTSISLSGVTEPLSVEPGTSLDSLGIYLNIQCSDGSHGTSTLKLTDSICSGYDANASGTQTVTIQYRGYTKSFQVRVGGEEPVTEAPTEAPTEPPTQAPTEPVTEAPTEAPTEPPTQAPTEPVTEAPTETPTEPATEAPTEAPTEQETEAPTQAPTEPETEGSTQAPTEPVTESATEPQTQRPTESETNEPTDESSTEINEPDSTTSADTEASTEDDAENTTASDEDEETEDVSMEEQSDTASKAEVSSEADTDDVQTDESNKLGEGVQTETEKEDDSDKTKHPSIIKKLFIAIAVLLVLLLVLSLILVLWGKKERDEDTEAKDEIEEDVEE